MAMTMTLYDDEIWVVGRICTDFDAITATRSLDWEPNRIIDDHTIAA
jgi:hypothetical protein